MTNVISAHLDRLEDELGEANSFTQAIFLAAAGLANSRDTCAIQAVAEQLQSRLEKARCIIDDFRNQPLSGAVIDLKSLEKAVKAEIARRSALKKVGGTA